ncbi:Isoprenylcysteine carboxyl methyltransferase [Shewanella denitrificans OS217]|uniref:Isoprenylcysteine carboxyl methyltransferase n=1 Tax=Shewanella denitrificans (strain OS217 / ATCC BAA-1090 / DSM 15013) TaxID=318161 RepID=Q12K13_SHEDO|nr:isoprenylcysteine carboxylmethyltransferase family protein [Shewanella denitrificans]ABE56213.1 Isoprenylcysteine carboxyl methyltransferase [Shewanella denitrificans OS217]
MPSLELKAPSLELKVPPVAVMLLVALMMWLVSLITPVIALTFFVRLFIGAMFAVAGIAVALAGVISFMQAHTTVNPTTPNSASNLVDSGIYRFTRNPMYLGLLSMLLGWAVFLASPLALTGTVVFILYMNRFQIKPEEKALLNVFGEAFLQYQAKVRRWL